MVKKTMLEVCYDKAVREIKRGSVRVYDYLDNIGQDYDNVKNMQWLIYAIADIIYEEYIKEI